MNFIKRKILLRKVINDPSYITKADPNDHELLMDAIHQNYHVIWYIENPQPCLVELAIRYNVNTLRWLPKQCNELNLLAINIDPRALKFMPDPDETVQIAAVSKNGLMVGVIDDPSESVQMAAVKNISEAITRIKNPSLKAQCLAVGNDYILINKIQNPDIEAIKLAFELMDQQNKKTSQIVDLSNHSLTTDQWWELVQAYPKYYKMMNLNDDQISYAILCS